MKKRQIAKLAIIVLAFGAIVFLLMAGFPVGIYDVGPLPGKVPLGLDLTGGVYAVYETEQGGFTPEEYEAKLATTVSVLRNRLDEKGYTEATIVQQGTSRIRVEIPINETNQANSDNPNEITAFISDTGLLEFCDINGVAQITGAEVKQAARYVVTNADKSQEYVVRVLFNSSAADKFAAMTRESFATGKPLDIKLDGQAISSPVAQEEIAGGEAFISGGTGNPMSAEGAENLAIKIESGALPLVLHEIDNRTISASLGADALQRSLFAGMIGVAVLFVFMLIYYRLPGFVACVALSVYIFLIVLVLAVFQIQLTLPGIAGIILGIGMAVDANVIIFERFKEELAHGKTLGASMKAGFHKAMTTIIDSNVTTFIAGIVIAFFGVGTVKGFGYTLMIGIILSMFTAVVLTRWLMNIILILNVQNRKLYSIRKSDVELAAKGGR